MNNNRNPRNAPLKYEIHKNCQKYQLSKSAKSTDSHKNPMQAYMRTLKVPKCMVCNCKQIHIVADAVNLWSWRRNI